MYDVQDWAEVRRLHRDGWTNTDIAEKFGMSRNTVASLIASETPPRYERAPAGSLLDGFADAIAAMLDENPKAPATVIRERLVALGYSGGITILKECLAELRPSFVGARSYQRTSYLPGELAQLDWWETGIDIPVGKDASRKAFGLVTSLPHSAAHACVFTFSKTTADFCPALVGCFERLGGVPRGAVLDNDAAMVKPRRGGPAHLVDDVAGLFGALSLKPIVLRPRFPEGKGQDERMIGYLQTSFVPLRRFSSIEDLQRQHDTWARTVAFERRPRRLAGSVTEAWRVERGFLAALPTRCPQRISVSRSASPKTVSCVSATSTTRCRPVLPGDAFSWPSRLVRLWCSSTARNWAAIPAATCPPMLFLTRPMHAPCVSNAMPAVALRPRTSRSHR